jgi:SAM-dependent methyltransferase
MYNKIYSIYDSMHSKKDYMSEVDFICDNINNVNTILDVGCGTGTHAIELSKRGYVVTGIDPSHKMIDEAMKKDSNVQFFTGHLHETIYTKFDCVISMFNVINHILDLNDLLEYFTSISNSLNPGGVFVFDCFNQLATVIDEPKDSKYDVFRSNLTIEYTDNKLQHKIWPPSTIIHCIESAGMSVEKILKAHENIDANKNHYKIAFKCKKYESKPTQKYPNGSLLNELPPSDYQMGN